MTKSDFEILLKPLFERIKDRPLDKSLQGELNESFPAACPYCESILAACRLGDAADLA